MRLKTKFFITFAILSSFILINGCETEDDTNNNNANMGYNCNNNNDCVASAGGQYITLQDCNSVCGNNQTTTWNCLNSQCTEDASGNGLYNSLAICQNECENSPPSNSWNCVNSNCVEQSSSDGFYSSITDCQNECENSSNCNNFSIDNNGPYPIGGLSEVINFGNFYNSSTVNYELRLFSESVTTSGSGSYSGIGNMIYLNLHTDGTIAGNYNFNNNSFNPSVNTWDGGYFVNQNMYDYSMGMVFPTSASSGSVEVIDNGSYNYDVNITMNNNIIGCFSGQVLPYSGGSGSGGSSGGSSGSFGISEDGKNPKRF